MLDHKILGVYPVDTAANIHAAGDYFEKHAHKFSPKHRIEYARQLAEVQYTSGVRPSEKVAHYAHAMPRKNLGPALKIRDYLTGGHATEELDIIVKEAEFLSPLDVVALLDDFDKGNNLYGKYDRVPDPFDSVYVSEKVAEQHDDSSVWVGPTSDRLTKDQLQQWMENTSSRELLIGKFNQELAEGLASPSGWQVFSSLPDPHKNVIARLINDNVINGTVSPGRDSRSAAGEYANATMYQDSVGERLKGLLG
jgi:hypothetical protein